MVVGGAGEGQISTAVVVVVVGDSEAKHSLATLSLKQPEVSDAHCRAARSVVVVCRDTHVKLYELNSKILTFRSGLEGRRLLLSSKGTWQEHSTSDESPPQEGDKCMG
jgi:hypothetical protein